MAGVQKGTDMIKNLNGGGQCGFKKNESVEQLVKVNAQMLKLLRDLDITPLKEYGGDEDDCL